MCVQWIRDLYSVVITQQSNPPISQFISRCNEFTSVLSMFVYNRPNMCNCEVGYSVTLTSLWLTSYYLLHAVYAYQDRIYFNFLYVLTCFQYLMKML